MWKLTSERNPSTVYCFLVGKEYSVGRRDCDILISDDMSISRKHAVIKVIHPESNLAFPDRKSVLFFKDLSKLGTQFSDGRIANGQERNLKDGDWLIFGTAGISRFNVSYFPVIFTTSCLAPTSKKDVKRNVLRLGGHLVNEWCDQCEGVVMNSLSVTIKVISALLSLKPVFTPQYLEDLVKAADTSTNLPIAEDYLPALSESQVSSADVSFGADARRRTLFQGKTFIFLSPLQYKKLHASLELGGANTRLITSADEIDALASGKDCCIMAPDASGSQIATSWMQSVQSVLKRTKRRMIAESEIGFAVLYCSTKIHCNSSSDFNVPRSTVLQQSLSENVAQFGSQASQRPACDLSLTIASRSVVPVEAGPSCAVRTPVPPIKIKEETLSQPATEAPIIQNKKRNREEIDAQNSNALATFDPSQDNKKKCRLETRSNNNIVATVPSAINSADPEIIEGGQNKRLDADSRTKTIGDSSTSVVVKSKFSTMKEVKEGLRAIEPESLEMDFSIGTCIEQSGNTAKIEAIETPVKKCFAPVNRDGGSVPNVVQIKDQHENFENDFKPPLPIMPYSKENFQIHPGYLTTLLPIKVNIDPDFEQSRELPSNLVVTEVRNLVIRKPPRQHRSEGIVGRELVIWNGKPVKNFKKFKRHLVSHGLPRVIGGRSLVVHQSIPTAAQEEWFRQEQEAESQKAYSELLSQELASWQPISRRQ